ncbi:CTP synthase [Chlamydiia bacterium]|jgi:CTP synthase|nr:CTP synthase [Chlamydiia bacterium]
MDTHYIFVTGGVVSSLGKGITSAAIGALLEGSGYTVDYLKFDPYLNVDPGTMNPAQHGEVYVTKDGGETDLDMGHCHRFTNSDLCKICSVSSGQIYDTVIKRERKGDYLGNTVQIIPHITDEIKRRIHLVNDMNKTDFLIIEVGGTAGDIESLPFLEAIRQFCYQFTDQCLNIHLSYVPYIKSAKEIKTKPTQRSVQILRQIGITPDILICRSERELSQATKEKISRFCSIDRRAVIGKADVEDTIYSIPLSLHKEGLVRLIEKKFNLDKSEPNLTKWEKYVELFNTPSKEVKIALVGKYVKQSDSYKSVYESCYHAATQNNVRLKIVEISAETLADKESTKSILSEFDGCLIPGGFGDRGWEGKILAAEYCRTSNKPLLGICLGMQVVCVEFFRNVCGLEGANSTEIHPNCSEPIISLISEQHNLKHIGGTMRLGDYQCTLEETSKAYAVYGDNEIITERHRHRYEFNNKYKKLAAEKGLVIAGTMKNSDLVEVVEVTDHPFYMAAQFHPEFLSKPDVPHPLFFHFIKVAK